MTTAGRRARQRDEIFELLDSGERPRAFALAREHLLSFPGDQPLFALLLNGPDESATRDQFGTS